MTDKREKPLFIDMDFGEALKRFAKTDKQEADQLVESTKRKKKAGKDKLPPGTIGVNRKDEGGDA